ncbi:flagellar protein FlhE [Halomonas sp. HP20-15]|uniref:flagellar protein FlhE n=1 Tax=Halomonas sp. HP20-15 TaxID=3085901 RepID=UPI002981AA40|nr:flagellar protein FlhE [Halomonas sp. HP20-15]MDW5375665.1 flagellar protein FlhE [Halomonas sp. HP20-15]
MNVRSAPWRGLLRFSGVALTSLGIASAFAPVARAGAAGSWVGEAPSVRLFTPGREVASQPIQAPAAPADGEITSISWRFTSPPGTARLEARLCHPQRCLRLITPRGQSEALAGLTASGPFVVRFRLPESARSSAPLRVEGLQLIVNYR